MDLTPSSMLASISIGCQPRRLFFRAMSSSYHTRESTSSVPGLDERAWRGKASPRRAAFFLVPDERYTPLGEETR